MTVAARACIALVLIGPIVRAANGQGSADARLATRLDKPTFIAVSAIVDSARLAKLPTAPLVDKALEGAAKGSDGQKIVAAVHQLSVRMGSAKRVLRTNANADEVNAAVSALDAGVSVHDLALVAAASGKRPVTMPLTVLADLIERKVPVPTATNLVVQMARSGVKDSEFALFQRNVRADVDHGADPAVAATTRARGLVLRPGNGAKPSE